MTTSYVRHWYRVIKIDFIHNPLNQPRDILTTSDKSLEGVIYRPQN